MNLFENPVKASPQVCIYISITTLKGCGPLPLKHIQKPLASSSPVKKPSISLDILQANSRSPALKTTPKFLWVSKIDNQQGPTV